jgi:hypothetical protein
MTVRKRNIVFFVGRDAERWAGRAEGRLGSDVGMVFAAASIDEFVQITSHSAGQWDILVADSSAINGNPEEIRSFAAANPDAIIAAAVSPADAGTLPRIRGLRIFQEVQDLERWIEMMGQLMEED